MLKSPFSQTSQYHPKQLAYGIGALISLIFLGVFIRNVNLSELGTTLSTANYFFLIIALVSQFVGHWIRSLRWSYLIAPIKRLPTKSLFAATIIGFSANVVLPFRLGEIVRAVSLSDMTGVSRTAALATIVLERLADLLIIILLWLWLWLGHVFFVPNQIFSSIFLNLGFFSIATLVIVGGIVWLIRHDNRHILAVCNAIANMLAPLWRDRLRMFVWKFSYGIRMQKMGWYITMFAAATVMQWVFYAATIFFTLEALAIHLSPSNILIIFATVYLSLALPSGPGFIGTLQYPVSAALIGMGINTGLASSFAIVLSIIIVPAVMILGIWYTYRLGHHLPWLTLKEEDASKKHMDAGLSIDISSTIAQNRLEQMRVFFDGYFRSDPVSRLIHHLGIVDQTQIVRAFRGGSTATTVLITKEDRLVVRKIDISNDQSKLKGQYHWLKICQHLPEIPRLIDVRETSRYFFYDMEYKPHFRSAFEYLHTSSDADTCLFVNNVLKFCFGSLYELKPEASHQGAFQHYIDDKLVKRVEQVAAINPRIADLLKYDMLVVNGVEYKNFPELISLLTEESRLCDLDHYRETPVHGDVTADNLLSDDKGNFILLDPNYENAVSSPEIDMAKLYQSFRGGYEFIIRLEEAEVAGNNIRFMDWTSRRYAMLVKHLDEQMPKYLTPSEIQRISLHEAIHYARMLPYRQIINPNTVPIFYTRMIKMLNVYLFGP